MGVEKNRDQSNFSGELVLQAAKILQAQGIISWFIVITRIIEPCSSYLPMPRTARKTISKRKKTVKPRSTRKSKRSRPRKSSSRLISVSLPADRMREQLLDYSKQIDSYLRKINAKIETFNFAVDTINGGLTVDCSLKATIDS